MAQFSSTRPQKTRRCPACPTMPKGRQNHFRTKEHPLFWQWQVIGFSNQGIEPTGCFLRAPLLPACHVSCRRARLEVREEPKAAVERGGGLAALAASIPRPHRGPVHAPAGLGDVLCLQAVAQDRLHCSARCTAPSAAHHLRDRHRNFCVGQESMLRGVKRASIKATPCLAALVGWVLLPIIVHDPPERQARASSQGRQHRGRVHQLKGTPAARNHVQSSAA